MKGPSSHYGMQKHELENDSTFSYAADVIAKARPCLLEEGYVPRI